MSKYYQPTPKEVREARLFANLTQQECAELCLITGNTWARYEQGLTQMPAPIWKLFEYAIAHKEASMGIKTKAKDLEAQRLAQEEKEKMEQLAREWDPETYRRELIDAEAKNWRYRDGRPVV